MQATETSPTTTSMLYKLLSWSRVEIRKINTSESFRRKRVRSTDSRERKRRTRIRGWFVGPGEAQLQVGLSIAPIASASRQVHCIGHFICKRTEYAAPLWYWAIHVVRHADLVNQYFYVYSIVAN